MNFDMLLTSNSNIKPSNKSKYICIISLEYLVVKLSKAVCLFVCPTFKFLIVRLHKSTTTFDILKINLELFLLDDIETFVCCPLSTLAIIVQEMVKMEYN